MTLVWRCPHCKNRYHGINSFWKDRHKLNCWPEDSPFWNEGERQRLLDDPWLNDDTLEGGGEVGGDP